MAAPGTSVFIHWLVGMVFVFYFASFILVLREVLRPGVLWFLRNLNDPEFNPIQEVDAGLDELNSFFLGARAQVILSDDPASSLQTHSALFRLVNHVRPDHPLGRLLPCPILAPCLAISSPLQH